MEEGAFADNFVVEPKDTDEPFTGGRDDVPPEVAAAQNAIYKKYSYLRISKNKMDFDDFCFPKKFQLQPPQKFCGEVMRPGSAQSRLLVDHKPGSGKTCLIIQILLPWLTHTKPILVMPATLRINIRNELRSPCAGGRYLTDEEAAYISGLAVRSPERREVIAESNRRIDKDMMILSFNQFLSMHKSGRVPMTKLFIIDEAHYLGGTSQIAAAVEEYAAKLSETDAKIVAATATPIFGNVKTLEPLFRVLGIPDFDIGKYVDVVDGVAKVVDRSGLLSKCAGFVSYYAGAPAYTYPKMTVHYERLLMSDFQRRAFRKALEGKAFLTDESESALDSFYSKSQAVSMIAYPGGTAKEGAGLLAGQMDDIGKHSCKIGRLLKLMKKKRGPKGAKSGRGKQHMIIYCRLKGAYGMAVIKKVLKAKGYFDFAKDGPGKARFAVLSGDETSNYKATVIDIFNSRENDDCSQIQYILGTAVIREGVSFFRVGIMIVLSPCWSSEMMEQIFMRVCRYCSHKNVPSRQRRVDIYVLLAWATKPTRSIPALDGELVSPGALGALVPESIDEYIYARARLINVLSAEASRVLADAAIDKRLFQ